MASETGETGGASEETKAVNPPASGPSSSSLPCGFVVGVLTRNWRDYVCTLVPKESGEGATVAQEYSSTPGWVLATPWDRRVPRVRIFASQPNRLAKDRYVSLLCISLKLTRTDSCL